ncbi:hypothetical protein QH73_0012360 [Scytonema millei VB511283]|uniref:Uncharacterized protein n=1 Tax=Scytonema millei VB511283 TaxID=1245923 RepID=A0A9X5E562_9CYAN|nr:hypothetical protein [Scytonema millei]NHC35441.1 hypothetical protein [Scytonema millei VB511283]
MTVIGFSYNLLISVKEKTAETLLHFNRSRINETNASHFPTTGMQKAAQKHQ